MSLENNPAWWVIVIALGVLLLLIYLDVNSRPKQLRWARFTALILLVASLVALYASPYTTTSVNNVDVAWKTDNTNSSSADSLNNLGFEFVENINEYNEIARSKEVSKLIVLGDGLEQWELKDLPRIDLFIPSKHSPEGVLDFNITRAIEQSRLILNVQLKLNDSISLVLSGSGIEAVEKRLSNQTEAMFEVVPKVSGYLTYQIDGIRNGDTLFSEIIPLHVERKQKNNVLMLANTPSFEFRGLKNYLAESGFGIAERLKVSSDLFHQAFTNVNERRLTNLSTRLLDDFQLIIIDAGAYNDLTKTEQRRIRTKLEKGELGLVLMGGKGAESLVSWRSRSEEVFALGGSNGKVELTTSKWTLSGQTTSIPMGSNKVAQIKEFGLGQIVRPLFIDSYLLKLEAEKKVYALLWQSVLADVIGSTAKESDMEVSRFPRVNNQVKVQVNVEDLEELKIEDVRLASSQDWFSSSTWNATYWPMQRGWQTVIADAKMKGQFFAFDSTDWILQDRNKKQTQTAVFVGNDMDQAFDVQPNKIAVSKWLFLAIFLISITFLWVEQRVQ